MKIISVVVLASLHGPDLRALDLLAEELKEIDPAAFNGYEGLLWSAHLDRWLY